MVFLLYTLSLILTPWANAGRGQKLAVLADLFDGLIRHVDSSSNSQFSFRIPAMKVDNFKIVQRSGVSTAHSLRRMQLSLLVYGYLLLFCLWACCFRDDQELLLERKGEPWFGYRNLLFSLVATCRRIRTVAFLESCCAWEPKKACIAKSRPEGL